VMAQPSAFKEYNDVDLMETWRDNTESADDRPTTAERQQQQDTQDLGRLTHVDETGRARMVDVSAKSSSIRLAEAACEVHVPASVAHLLTENVNRKGNAFAVAQIAGVMAAKQTSTLIPLCHNVCLSDVQIALELKRLAALPEGLPAGRDVTLTHTVHVRATVRCTGNTGVEMEALTAVTVAALTVYDMCKAASKRMRITNCRLIRKQGGKSGDYAAVEGD